MEVLEFATADVRDLTDAERSEVTDLAARVAAASDEPPLPEPERRAVTHPEPDRDTSQKSGAHGQVVLARRHGALVGSSFLFPARDGSTAVYLVVDPGTPDIASPLLERAVADAPAGAPLHLWAMHAGQDDDERARAHGFTPERDLLQLRVPLPLAPDVIKATRPLKTRPFVPGRDEEAWVATNNQAFEGHPEQGGWTVEQLRQRMAADWVELDGFLLADDPDGDGLIGSCWTKVHRDHHPFLGEIYVIAVDPRHHGEGWGRSLTVAGLQSLSDRGVTVGMLYADATNEAAVGLYHSLGFRVHHVDRSYRHDPTTSGRG